MTYPESSSPEVVMTVGGSDSGGGAGIQADLKTFSAHGVYATTVITAVTAQNTLGVEQAEPIPLEVVSAQLKAVATDLPPAATKTGLLGRSEIVQLVAEHAFRLPNLVVDPVLVDRHGNTVVDDSVPDTYMQYLIPRAALATPNHREAALLADRPIEDEADMRAAAEYLASTTRTPFLITGGRLAPPHPPLDVFSDGIKTDSLPGRRVRSRNVHGTGDALSASIAARLATGSDLLLTIAAARAWVSRAITGAAGWKLGRGEGPIDHFGWA
ncbi:MAG: bifunctional hydroxymethylpyrimidine kinase/phosphomethylpyrimidine kinase [Acidimicrobiia bacterium]|nr:bifunctional hydroxymethylpyrimidine kinase/phosphomethylpyrimidine kinase [Acidimicrobiia bacterium]